jgi:hypothetical protein
MGARLTNALKLANAFFVLLMPLASAAEQCRVLDPDLQDAYSGPCVNGLAEGHGIALGSAQYRGQFKAGRKHGKGVKVWANGDTYAGDFVEDRREGRGVYTLGRGPWEGERYEGDFLNDRRHGTGTYRYRSGDVYTGPWANDAPTGRPTPMMIARRKFREEIQAAVAKEGQKVCREMPVGVAGRDWIRGVVVATDGRAISVRIEDPGQHKHMLGNIVVNEGAVVHQAPTDWVPCW